MIAMGIRGLHEEWRVNTFFARKSAICRAERALDAFDDPIDVLITGRQMFQGAVGVFRTPGHPIRK